VAFIFSPMMSETKPLMMFPFHKQSKSGLWSSGSEFSELEISPVLINPAF